MSLFQRCLGRGRPGRAGCAVSLVKPGLSGERGLRGRETYTCALLETARQTLLPGYQATPTAVANCADTKGDAALGGHGAALPRPREPSRLFSPGRTRGCQACGDSKTDSSCLMTSFLQIEPESALLVPSGFALKCAVNAARRRV